MYISGYFCFLFVITSSLLDCYLWTRDIKLEKYVHGRPLMPCARIMARNGRGDAKRKEKKGKPFSLFCLCRSCSRRLQLEWQLLCSTWRTLHVFESVEPHSKLSMEKNICQNFDSGTVSSVTAIVFLTYACTPSVMEIVLCDLRCSLVTSVDKPITNPYDSLI